jgi:hypothetical protein
MKKNDLKKLALMGITGGIVAAAQAPAEAFEMNTASPNMIAGSCGSHGCSTAYNERGYNQNNFTNYSQDDYYQGQSSCSASGGYRAQSSCSTNSGYRAQNSCSSNRGYQGTSYSHSCGGQPSNNAWSSSKNSSRDSYYTADNDDNYTQSSTTDPSTDAPQTVSEDEFKAKLSPKSKADYDKLSAEGRAKALKIASHTCAGKNDCKGQNACKTDKNDCAGQGGCKSQSKCAATPDQAVKAASLQDKRAGLNTRNTYSPR